MNTPTQATPLILTTNEVIDLNLTLQINNTTVCNLQRTFDPKQRPGSRYWKKDHLCDITPPENIKTLIIDAQGTIGNNNGLSTI